MPISTINENGNKCYPQVELNNPNNFNQNQLLYTPLLLLNNHGPLSKPNNLLQSNHQKLKSNIQSFSIAIFKTSIIH